LLATTQNRLATKTHGQAVDAFYINGMPCILQLLKPQGWRLLEPKWLQVKLGACCKCCMTLLTKTFNV
jgi:hypothetical protein